MTKRAFQDIGGLRFKPAGAGFAGSLDWDEVHYEFGISCYGFLFGHFKGKLQGFRQNARAFADPDFQGFQGRISLFPAFLLNNF